MNKKNYRYLLLSKNSGFDTQFFYTLEEAKIAAKNIFYSETTIIDLENENIKWQGCE
ncbi:MULTISPECIES: hypothetical protein [unclassified Spiroplasma]|uniref:hypothetical protein n=1 Tax=unclassified Spiroplasma TaxID=2637901 RepID=UPI0030D49A7F